MKELIENLNLPKQVIDKTDKFMTTLFGPSVKEIGELFADKIKYRRLKNQVKIFKRTTELLEENGLQARELNFKTLIPLIENSSLEEDELLQEKWSNLIANMASNPESGLEPKLVKTLSNLTSLEAQVLDFIYAFFKNRREKIFEESKNSKWRNYKSIDDIKLENITIKFSLIKERFKLNDEFAKICVDNLEALGLVKYEDPQIEIDKGFPSGEIVKERDGEDKVEIDIDISASYINSDDVNLTTYGNYFIKQCKME